MPKDLNFTALEVWRALPCPQDVQEGKHILHSSDAHYLGDMLEAEITIGLEDKSVAAFLDYLQRPVALPAQV